MKKLYTNPEVEVIKFASEDTTNTLNIAGASGTVTAGIGTVNNMSKVKVGCLHQ